MATIASAPDLSTDLAHSGTSVIAAGLLASIGFDVLFFTSGTISDASFGSVPISEPTFFTCGQERFSSIARKVNGSSSPASCAKPAAESAKMLIIRGTFLAAVLSYTSSSSLKNVIPGFARPIALRHPPSTAAIVGLEYPSLGSNPIDLVTTAPAPHSTILGNNSNEIPRIPEASMVGDASLKFPILTPIFSPDR